MGEVEKQLAASISSNVWQPYQTWHERLTLARSALSILLPNLPMKWVNGCQVIRVHTP
jgi:hypothetical protein